MKASKLVVLGASGFAEEVADLAFEISGIETVAFVEGINRERCGSWINGRPVVWIDEVADIAPEAVGICAVGTTKRQDFVHAALKMGLRFTSLVHPSAVIAESAELDEGVIVSAGVVVGARARVARHTILNRGSLLGHHVEVGSFVTVGPGCNIGGYAVVGDLVYLGMGSTILDRVEIGHQSAVGAGALVTRNVAPNLLVMGVPAEPLKPLPDGM